MKLFIESILYCVFVLIAKTRSITICMLLKEVIEIIEQNKSVQYGQLEWLATEIAEIILKGGENSAEK